jgi:hypothetical protein
VLQGWGADHSGDGLYSFLEEIPGLTSEPFSGSGTTIIAAEMTGRACHAIELNPAYVDVAIRRWQDFTGEAAVFEGSGAAFADVATERGVPCPADRTSTASTGPDLALSLPDDDLRPLTVSEEA